MVQSSAAYTLASKKQSFLLVLMSRRLVHVISPTSCPPLSSLSPVLALPTQTPLSLIAVRLHGREAELRKRELELERREAALAAAQQPTSPQRRSESQQGLQARNRQGGGRSSSGRGAAGRGAGRHNTRRDARQQVMISGTAATGSDEE